MEKLDLWLRSVWAFWDTHGTRLLGVVSTLYSLCVALVIALSQPDSKIAASLVAIGSALGWMTTARGNTNAAAQKKA
jgi:hypothetical protein